jgi:Zn-dependent protease
MVRLSPPDRLKIRAGITPVRHEYPFQTQQGNHPMDDIEEEIRRRILAERAAAGPSKPAPPELATGEAQPYYAAPPPLKNPTFLQKKQRSGGVVGVIASLLILLAKIGAPVLALLSKLKFLAFGLKLLTVGKVLLTIGSMLASMWVYARFYGWPFGVGLVMLIFVHECGHVLAARMRGLPVTMMLFIPLMGAFVKSMRRNNDPVENAFVAIMGPVIGGLGAAACALVYPFTGKSFWLALALWGLFVNLMNLVPFPTFDGAKVVAVFSRKYQVSARDKWRYGVAYFGLAAILLVGCILLVGYLRTIFSFRAV